MIECGIVSKCLFLASHQWLLIAKPDAVLELEDTKNNFANRYDHEERIILAKPIEHVRGMPNA
jgi:hypothetical protein